MFALRGMSCFFESVGVHGSRRGLLVTVVTFFFVGKFLFVGLHALSCCMRSKVWLVSLVLDSLHLQRLFTMSCGCWLGSTSFSGGHQVDGLPPASSHHRVPYATGL